MTGGSNIKQIYKNNYNFEVGKAEILNEGSDVCFLVWSNLRQCFRGIRNFEKEHNIKSRVINMHTIKPIDKEAIIESANTRLHVCVEEHNIIGGLASAISEVKTQEDISVKQINLGINDTYIKSGSYKHMLSHFNLSTDKIVKMLLEY